MHHKKPTAMYETLGRYQMHMLHGRRTANCTHHYLNSPTTTTRMSFNLAYLLFPLLMGHEHGPLLTTAVYVFPGTGEGGEKSMCHNKDLSHSVFPQHGSVLTMFVFFRSSTWRHFCRGSQQSSGDTITSEPNQHFHSSRPWKLAHSPLPCSGIDVYMCMLEYACVCIYVSLEYVHM